MKPVKIGLSPKTPSSEHARLNHDLGSANGFNVYSASLFSSKRTSTFIVHLWWCPDLGTFGNSTAKHVPEAARDGEENGTSNALNVEDKRTKFPFNGHHQFRQGKFMKLSRRWNKKMNSEDDDPAELDTSP